MESNNNDFAAMDNISFIFFEDRFNVWLKSFKPSKELIEITETVFIMKTLVEIMKEDGGYKEQPQAETLKSEGYKVFIELLIEEVPFYRNLSVEQLLQKGQVKLFAELNLKMMAQHIRPADEILNDYFKE